MLGPALTLALLAAAPTAAPSGPEDVTLAAPPFESHGFPRKDRDVAFYSEHFAQRLAANGLQVITTQQITSVREMEKLRQLAGCPATSAECIIELGHMLGAQGVVRGTLAKIGETFQLDVRVYQASDGKVLAARSASARTSEGLIRAMDQLATEVAGLVKTAFGVAPKPPELVKKDLQMPPPPPLKPVAPPPPMNWQGVAWIPGGIGLLTAGAGGLCLAFAEGKRTELKDGKPNYQGALETRAQGEQLATFGTGLAIGGGAVLLVGGALALFGAPKSPVAVTAAPSGVMVEVKLP